jgi:hypothetical protein
MTLQGVQLSFLPLRSAETSLIHSQPSLQGRNVSQRLMLSSDDHAELLFKRDQANSSFFGETTELSTPLKENVGAAS